MVPAMESRGGAGGPSRHDRLKSGAGLHSQITFSKTLSSFPDKGDLRAEKVEPGRVAALSARPRCCYFRAAAAGEAKRAGKRGPLDTRVSCLLLPGLDVPPVCSALVLPGWEGLLPVTS